MAVPLDQAGVVIRRDVVDALRLATREAVNVGALEVTEDARRRVRIILGPEQRLSRLRTRKRGDRESRVTAATIAAGGSRVNPYYRQADSKTRPVALVGARGPAQFIEHDRRGGYDVRPHRRTGASQATAEDLARLQADIFGRGQREAATTATRVQRAGALRTPFGMFGRVTPGPIRRPNGGPITAAFRAGADTITDKAVATVDESMTRTLGRF